MSTHQIEREKWSDYLDALTAHNQTRNVTVEMEHSELGPQTLISEKPLLALETDLKDKLEPSIIVIAGDPQGSEPEALTHRVMEPTALWVKEDDQGRPEALDIEANEGKTVIKFM